MPNQQNPYEPWFVQTLAIPAATMKALETEGISTVFDLLEFDKDSIKTLVSSFRKRTGANAVTFGHKSEARLTTACQLDRPTFRFSESWNGGHHDVRDCPQAFC